MAQTTYTQDMPIGIPGGIADGSPTEKISRIVSTQSLYEVTIGTPANSTHYLVNILQNGTTVIYDYTSDASATAIEITAGLIALIEAGTQLVRCVTGGSSLTFTIESTSEDYPIVVTLTTGGTGYLVALLQAQGQELPFGVFVVTDPLASLQGKQCRLPRLTGEITAGTGLGIVIADTSMEYNAGGYPDKTAVPILRKGSFFFKTESTIAEGGAIFCRFADPTADYGLGSLRHDADTADAVAIPTAVCTRGAAAGGIAIGQINLP
jgi:hypothetical protein